MKPKSLLNHFIRRRTRRFLRQSYPKSSISRRTRLVRYHPLPPPTSDMGIPGNDVVLIQSGKSPGDPTVVTVNCPDKSGLGCDLVRIILEFGLSITRGDFSTDGIWCYVVFWVIPYSSSPKVDWGSLKSRLFSVCPSCLGSYFFNLKPAVSSPSVYILTLCCLDRKGLLHDVTKALTELEFTIQRVKVMTAPDGRVLDLFFISDGMELLHTKKRQKETTDHLIESLGDYCISCELQLPGPEFENLKSFSSLPPEVAEELFGNDLSEKKACLGGSKQFPTSSEKATINVDNLLSPAHSLLQIKCLDQKCLFYDILRTSKDLDIQIAHGRFSPTVKGYRSMDIFIRQVDGKKNLDPKHLSELCSHLKEEMINPLRVIVVNRGPDTELLIANPVELCGKGRPRVFYDVTLALKLLGICIFSAEIGIHSTADRQWEVYRFLLNENHEFPLASSRARGRIVDRVRRTLMGW